MEDATANIHEIWKIINKNMGKVENRPFKWSVPDGADDAVTEQMNQTALFIRIAICRFCLEKDEKTVSMRPAQGQSHRYRFFLWR